MALAYCSFRSEHFPFGGRRDGVPRLPGQMEPMRPVIDRAFLNLIDAVTFTGSAFSIQHDGVCRMNPEPARRVDQLTLQSLQTVKPLHGRSPITADGDTQTDTTSRGENLLEAAAVPLTARARSITRCVGSFARSRFGSARKHDQSHRSPHRRR